MLYRSDKRNSLRGTCLYSAVDFEIFFSFFYNNGGIKSTGLDPNGVATAEGTGFWTGFASIHVIAILYSALVLNFGCPSFESHISKTFFTNYKKIQCVFFYIIMFFISSECSFYALHLYGEIFQICLVQKIVFDYKW